MKEQLSTSPGIQILGKKIRKLREDKSLSQEGLAEIVGVHRTYIGMIERGEKNITIGTLIKVAQALNTTSSNILEGI